MENREFVDVSIIFTEVSVTHRAVGTAMELARGVGMRIRILVPRRSFSDRKRTYSAQEVQKHHQLATAVASSVNIRVDVEVCDDAEMYLLQNRQMRSILILPRRHRWSLAPEQRFARRMQRAGYVIVDVDGGE